MCSLNGQGEWIEQLQGRCRGTETQGRAFQAEGTAQAKTWQKKNHMLLESCELSCLFQALPGEGWLFSGKTLGQKNGRLELSLLPQEHKGFSRVEPDTYIPLLLLLDKAPESSLGTNPTPFPSPLFSLPSVLIVIFLSTQSFWNWLLPVGGGGQDLSPLGVGSCPPLDSEPVP